MKQSTAAVTTASPPPCKRCQVMVATNCGLAGRVLGQFRKCVLHAASFYNDKAANTDQCGEAAVDDTRQMLQCCVRVSRLTSLQIIKPCTVMLRRQSPSDKLTAMLQSKTAEDLQCPTHPKIMKPCRVMIARQSHIAKLTAVLQSRTAEDLQCQNMLQFHTQPKTVKQRMENCQMMCQYNYGYQEDVFDHLSPIKRKVNLLSDSSTMSEDTLSSVTSHSSNGPLLPWPVPVSSTPVKTSTPVSNLGSFQHWAFVHRRLKENQLRRMNTRSSKKWRLEVTVKGGGEKEFKEMVDMMRVEECSLRTEVEDVSADEVESYFSFT